MNTDFQIFNRKIVKLRRDRAVKSFPEHDFITKLSSQYILERLQDTGRIYQTALDIGCHNGLLGLELINKGIAGNIVFCDLSEKFLADITPKYPRIVADEEFLPFAPESFDLVVSAMSMHTINDLPGALIQIRQSLKPGGMFMASIPGVATLKELRQVLSEAEIEATGGVAPHVHPFSDVKTIGYLLQRAGFKQPVADSEQVTISYSNIRRLLQDIKLMGEGNSLLTRQGSISRKTLDIAEEKYQSMYNDGEGGIFTSVEIITMTGMV